MSSNDTMRSISRVQAVAPSTLRLTWSDGAQAEFSIERMLQDRRFAALLDPSAFERVKVGDWGHSLEWATGEDLGADTLWLETLSALRKEDTRRFLEWRLRHALSLSRAAEALGLSRRMVAYYSNGEKPVPRNILLACEGWEASQSSPGPPPVRSGVAHTLAPATGVSELPVQALARGLPGAAKEPAMHVHGRCHCGALEWEAEVDPAAASICHCTDCQTFSGAPFRASVPSAPGSFRMTRGQPKIYVKTAASGARRAQGFCGDCGAPVYSAPADNAQVHMLRLGTLAQRGEIAPKRQIWCGSALAWAQDVRELPGVAGQG